MELVRSLEKQVIEAIGEYGTYFSDIWKKVKCSPYMLKKILSTLKNKKIIRESKEDVVLYDYRGQKSHKKLKLYKLTDYHEMKLDDYIRDSA